MGIPAGKTKLPINPVALLEGVMSQGRLPGEVELAWLHALASIDKEPRGLTTLQRDWEAVGPAGLGRGDRGARFKIATLFKRDLKSRLNIATQYNKSARDSKSQRSPRAPPPK